MKRKINDMLYLIGYSLKSLVMDSVEFLTALKKAKTWSFILYAAFFLGAYYRNATIIKLVIPLILLLYIARQNKEPEYNKALRERAFIRNDEIKIMQYYEKYKKQCFFSKKEPLSYEDYKKDEIFKIEEKKHIQSGPDYT